MHSLIISLSWNYLRGTKSEKSISTMVAICFVGILIGSFALALVMAVMNGFEKVTHEKMQGIHAQIIIRAYGDELNMDVLTPILQEEFPEIEAFSPSTLEQVIIQEPASDEITNVVVIKGIDPESEVKVSALPTKLVATLTEKKLQAALHNNYILIGDKLAKTLDVTPGNQVELLSTGHEEQRARKITLNKTRAFIGGTFSTGIDEFDNSLIFCTLPFLKTLFPNAGTTQVNVKLKPGVDEDALIKKLRDRLNIEVFSWKELYPALVSALKLEKYVMFFILALITLVASMNIVSLLFMQITQKRGDIAILRAMGMPSSQITTIFLMLGMSISLVASLLGLLLACLVSWLLEHYPFITLPDAYYVTHLPAKMEWHLVILVFIVIMGISFIATWFPARRTRTINIAEVLRFEA